MALAKIQKIQLVASKSHKEKFLERLQDLGVLEIHEIDEESELRTPYQSFHKLQEVELNYANLDFAIKLLSPYAPKRGVLEGPIALSVEEIKQRAENFDYKPITNSCSEIEENLTQAKNRINTLKNELEQYSSWKKLNINLNNLKGTETSVILIGSVKTPNFEEFYKKLDDLTSLFSLDVIEKSQQGANICLITTKANEGKIRQLLSEYKFNEVELPELKGSMKDYCQELESEIAKQEAKIKENEKELEKLAKHSDDLMIVHDYLGWELEKLEEEKKIGSTDYSFVVTGWFPEKYLKKLEEELEEISDQFAIEKLELAEGETPPVVIRNNAFLRPFESVTGVYGLPLHTEVDPTPFLAAYFIIFFALCLTDAGYGLIMFIVMALMLKFMKLGEGVKKLVKLLMYGGIVTFIIGAMFGGWFGLTPEQVPSSLTYEAANGESMFLFQRVNSLTDPITVLILALGLGFVQILTGVFIKLVHDFRTNSKLDAILDTGTWAFMLTGIGFFILAATGIIPEPGTEIGKWWIIGAAILLVLTQGRKNKGIIAKLFSGILSLYDLVGYMSDVLSYSRLLALGLATAIIGLAVNVIAVLLRDMVPYVGWVLMAIVFVGGHVFNLLINALGSFIHSGRLQFVEFFGKFMEGGGNPLKPFSKKSKYVFIKTNK